MSNDEKKNDLKVEDKRRFVINEDGSVTSKADEEGEEPKPTENVEDQNKAGEDAASSNEDELDDPCGEEPCEECEEDYKQLPPIDFNSFVFSLSMTTMSYLGYLPDPVNNEVKKNLALAKQHIDLLGMLQKKTKGNLEEEEDKFLRDSLYDLRLKFVEACEKK